MTHSRPRIYELLDEHGLAARRELGQNFVADPNTVRRIAHLSQVAEGDLVIEIGPGLGSLTLALVETGARVVAVEVDPGLAEVGAEILGDSAVVIERDAMTLDWDELISTYRPQDGGSAVGGVHVVSNLPYNIGTTLVLDILAYVPEVETITALVQSEVAERFAASPGSKIYGIPSVMARFYANSEIVGSVPPSVFVPKPKVESSVIRFERHGDLREVTHEQLATVVKGGFGQRRKMVRRSLGAILTEAEIEAAEVDPTQRAEQLSLADWIRLAQLVPSSS